jgi:hypothetical protein
LEQDSRFNGVIAGFARSGVKRLSRGVRSKSRVSGMLTNPRYLVPTTGILHVLLPAYKSLSRDLKAKTLNHNHFRLARVPSA